MNTVSTHPAEARVLQSRLQHNNPGGLGKALSALPCARPRSNDGIGGLPVERIDGGHPQITPCVVVMHGDGDSRRQHLEHMARITGAQGIDPTRRPYQDVDGTKRVNILGGKIASNIPQMRDSQPIPGEAGHGRHAHLTPAMTIMIGRPDLKGDTGHLTRTIHHHRRAKIPCHMRVVYMVGAHTKSHK